MITVTFVNQYTGQTVPDGVTVKFYALSDTTLTTVLDTQTLSGSKVNTSALSIGHSYQFVLSGTGAPTTTAHTFAVRNLTPTASFLAEPTGGSGSGSGAGSVTQLTADFTLPALSLFAEDFTTSGATEATIEVADGSFCTPGAYLLLSDFTNGYAAVVQVGSDSTKGAAAGAGSFRVVGVDYNVGASGTGANPGYVFSKATTTVTLGAPMIAPLGAINYNTINGTYSFQATNGWFPHDPLNNFLGYARIQYGGSFPGSPKDGQVFLRTDLNKLCYYNQSAVHWVNVADGTTVT